MKQTLVLLSVLLIAGVAGEVCKVVVQEPLPIVMKRFGSKTAILRRSLTNIEILQNETLLLHCPSGFTFNKNTQLPAVINATTLSLECQKNGVYAQETRFNKITYVSCTNGISQSLYESNVQLPGCDGGKMTLLVGLKLENESNVKRLGMCYDLGALQMHFISFLVYEPRNVLLETQPVWELSSLRLDKYIGGLTKYFQFTSKSEFQQLIERQKQLGDLFNPKLFEFASLIQDDQHSQELTDYNDLLNVVWLSALRTGNWKRWLHALRATTNNGTMDNKFDMRVGVSGVATLPMGNGCTQMGPLLLENSNGLTLKVPAHIWAHVRPLNPKSANLDEFVIVGHNSPYATISELSTFCTDICDEIPWLRDSQFNRMHLVPLYGVVHCCRPNDVPQLMEFPYMQHVPSIEDQTAAELVTNTKQSYEVEEIDLD